MRARGCRYLWLGHQWLAFVLVVFVIFGGLLFAGAEPGNQEEVQEGWLRLFDGTMSGWNASGGEWQTKDNVLTSDMAFTRRIWLAVRKAATG